MAVGVVAVALLLGFVCLENRTEVTLPLPTGPFAVGRSIFDWVDDGSRRELLAWIWYPAVRSPSAVVDDYIPAPMRAATERPRGGIIRLLTRDSSKVRAHSLRNAAIAAQRFPVVIMRAGASAPVVNHSSLAEDLASHGYVVVGFDAPRRTTVVAFPDGRVIARTPENNPELVTGEEFLRRGNRLLTEWTGDMALVLDRLERLNASDPSGRFTGRLDMTHVGLVGHSFGGAQAAQFCSQDLRCRAGIDIDGAPLGGVIRTGINRPFLFLLSDHGDFSSNAEDRRVYADIRSIYNRLPPDGKLLVVIHGANHFTFSDDGALLKSGLMRGVLRLFGRLRISGRRQLDITTYCVRTFFDAYLKGTPHRSPLEISSPQYPEIEVLH